jgi:putative addiction module component (TIGR02574 family)
MAMTLQALGIDQLGVTERLQLVQEIWDSIAAEVERSPLTAPTRRRPSRGSR